MSEVMNGCPIDHAALNSGCPVSGKAADFNPFEGPYQLDPAEALRWSRDEAPVFFAPSSATGWSPATTTSRRSSATTSRSRRRSRSRRSRPPARGRGDPEGARLRDEPHPRERGRARAHAASPRTDAPFGPGSSPTTPRWCAGWPARTSTASSTGPGRPRRRMLYEMPLTVALHFLGVPEEDMATLRTLLGRPHRQHLGPPLARRAGRGGRRTSASSGSTPGRCSTRCGRTRPATAGCSTRIRIQRNSRRSSPTATCTR